MYTWVKGNITTPQATIYPTNITLNSAAANYFEDVRWVKIGYNSSSRQIVIKPIHKKEIDLGLVNMEDLHKISYGKGYARVTNKAFVQSVSNEFNLKDSSSKYDARYDDEQDLLIIQF